MCTAVTYKTRNFYFGRTLDNDFSYREEVTVTPRKYPFHFRNGKTLTTHGASIGMATLVEDYPLYYEAANEWGRAMGGLYFPGNAHYFSEVSDREYVAPFE